MLHELYDWVLAWSAHPNARSALFFLAFAESSFFPLPPDILLIAMGVANPDMALWFAFLCSAGSVMGGCMGFGIGRVGGRPIVRRLLSESKRLATERLYNKYDFWAIAVAGFTPIPYKIFTITAGAFNIRFGKFLLASALSRPARFFLVGVLLKVWGRDIQVWIESYFNIASISFVVLLIGGFLIVRWLGNRTVRAR